ncbi:MAG: hypothetical protein HGA45_36610, partial [Chloroflexales bacterium]|nr:hypothetical protein [Chloroflexales bacterium]
MTDRLHQKSQSVDDQHRQNWKTGTLGMECSEARRLIDMGVHPGSTNPRNAALESHLAGCAACHSYQTSTSAQGLLAALLAEEAPARPTSPRPAEGRPRPPHMRPRRRTPWWRYAIIGALAVLALGAGLLVGRITRAAYTISGNLSAMQVTAAPTQAAGTPTLTVPTSQGRPSAGPAAGGIGAL